MPDTSGAMEEMTCRELVELVTAYLDDALPSADRSRFDEHIRDCRSCLAYLGQMRQTIRTVGCLSDDMIPAPVLDSLRAAFRGWKRA